MAVPGTVNERYPHLLVFDIGLTNCKAVLFGPAGSPLRSATRPYPTRRPASGLAEQDPADWWQAMVQATQSLWAGDGITPSSVAAISVTGHMHSLVAVAPDGEVLGPAIILGDQRAVTQSEAISDSLGTDAIYRITGAAMDPSMPAAKIRWLHEHDSARWRRSRWFLGVKDYVQYVLTGRVLTDPIDACATSLYDIRLGDWSAPLLEAAGVGREQLPEVRSSATIAGLLGRTAARALGLPSGVPVVVGAGDDIEVLGCGLVDPPGCIEHLGTTGSMLAVVSSPLLEPKLGLELYPHAVSGMWVVGASMTTAGAALQWAADILGFAGPGEALISSEIRTDSATHDVVFVPHLAGSRFPERIPDARAAWIGLELNVSRESLMRAAFEGVAFALRHMLEQVERLTGRQPRLIASGADHAGSDWSQLRATIYQRPLLRLERDPTALGAAILAATAAGLYPDLRNAVRSMVAPAGRAEPALSLDLYETRYRRYLRALDQLGPLGPKLAHAAEVTTRQRDTPTGAQPKAAPLRANP